MNELIKKYFRICIAINLILVFIVIAAGSIVRATGSGMGCPDWPTCFGKLIPPVNVSQVSWHPNFSFQEGEMIIKNETLLVAEEDFTSDQDFDDTNWRKYEKHDYAVFNPLHTWVEFINRLATVVLGFPIILMFLLSLFYIKGDRLNTLFSFGSLFMVGFQAWLGKIVVDQNLQGTTITYHMLGVFILIAFLLILYNRNRVQEIVESDTVSIQKMVTLSLIASLLSLVMIVLGTQVREEIDAIAKISSDRSQWIGQLSYVFLIHRSMIWLLLAFNVYIILQLRKGSIYTKHALWIGILLIFESLVGVVLSYLAMPAVAQPIHLIVASLLISVQFDLFIKLRNSNKTTLAKA